MSLRSLLAEFVSKQRGGFGNRIWWDRRVWCREIKLGWFPSTGDLYKFI